MNVKDLREELSMFDDAAEVMIADVGHRTAMQYQVDEVAEVTVQDRGYGAREDDTMNVVYLLRGGSPDEPYLASEARDEFGV